MSNVPFKKPSAPDGYMKATGAGTDADPYIIEQTISLPAGASTAANQTTMIGHLDGVETLLTTIDADTGSIATIAAAIQAAAEAIQTAVELLDDTVYEDDVPFVTGTSKVMALAGLLDDAATNAVTEGDVAVPRISSRRELYVQLRDAAGNERGLNIDANGAIAVTTGALPAGDNNIGNVDIASALPAGTNNIGDVDIAEKTITPAAGTAASSGDNTLVAAPGSGTRIVVSSILVQNESSTATTILLKDGATTKRRALLQNQGDGVAWAFPAGREWKLGDNAALVLNLSGANSHGYTIDYYTEVV